MAVASCSLLGFAESLQHSTSLHQRRPQSEMLVMWFTTGPSLSCPVVR